MKTLCLLRHAKSDWADARARDFDRPLNARGRRGATAMGHHVRQARWLFDRIIASPAVRVVETIELAATAWGRTFPVEWDRRIYLASAATLIDVLREVEGDPATLLLAGHNPGLEDLIIDLVPDDGSSPLRAVVATKFPTAAFAVLECGIDRWADIDSGCARMAGLTRPRDVDPELGPQVHD